MSTERCVKFSSDVQRLKAVQQRALNIIYSYFHFTLYITTLALAGIPTLQARRLDFTKQFFFSEKFVNPIIVYTTFSHPVVTLPLNRR